MNSQILGLRVGGTVLGLICLGQLTRLLAGAEVLVAGRQIPMWVSVVAVAIAGGLCIWLWKLSFAAGKQ